MQTQPLRISTEAMASADVLHVFDSPGEVLYVIRPDGTTEGDLDAAIEWCERHEQPYGLGILRAIKRAKEGHGEETD